MGPYAFELIIEAYLLARDWPHFLELQGDFLLQAVDTIEKSGARIAFPAPTTYFSRSFDNDSATARKKTPKSARSEQQESGIGDAVHPRASK